MITPPISRTGRGLKNIYIPPLKTYADSNNLETLSPTSNELKDLNYKLKIRPTIILTASYGYLIPHELLSIVSPNNALNVHPSLLPKLRGAAPIQWAIAKGMKETGVTIQTMQNEVFDSGDILNQIAHTIDEQSTFTSLSHEMGPLAGKLLVQTLENLNYYKTSIRKQDKDKITYAPKLHRNIGFIDFKSMDAHEIDRRYRAFSHQRSLSAFLINSKSLHQLHDISVSGDGHKYFDESDEEGTAKLMKTSLLIRCLNNSYLEVNSLKPTGKRIMNAYDWWNGFSYRQPKIKFIKYDSE